MTTAPLAWPRCPICAMALGDGEPASTWNGSPAHPRCAEAAWRTTVAGYGELVKADSAAISLWRDGWPTLPVITKEEERR